MADLNKLRQNKTFGWKPKTNSNNSIKDQIKDLRKKYPNNQEFGAEIAKLIREWD
mgnify:CR=1 FL=1